MEKLDLTISLPIDVDTRDKLRAVAGVTGHRYVTSLIRYYIAQGLRETTNSLSDDDYSLYADALEKERQRTKGVI